MKRYFYLLMLFSILAISLNAQEVDCEGTLRAWQADSSLREFMRTHSCSCPNPKQKPVCSEINTEPEPTPVPTPTPKPTPNPAEEQAKREAAWNARKTELLKLLKKVNDIELPLAPVFTPTPMKPDPAAFAELRSRTAQSIKQLNCSAYYGLMAAEAAVYANIEIRKYLDDDLDFARNTAEISSAAKKGEWKEGMTCPEIKIEVPEIPPPIEQNPQIRLFDSISNDLQAMIPEIISTKTQAKAVKDWQTEIKSDITRNRRDKAALDRKPNTTKNRTEKQKKDDEFDALIREAMAAESEAKNLQGKIDGYTEKVSKFQNVYDTVTKEPSRAKDFLPK
jgi:hypothetical protein